MPWRRFYGFSPNGRSPPASQAADVFGKPNHVLSTLIAGYITYCLEISVLSPVEALLLGNSVRAMQREILP